MTSKVDGLTPSDYVRLRRAIEDDYVAGRVVIRPDGWLVSQTEHRLLGEAGPNPPSPSQRP